MSKEKTGTIPEGMWKIYYRLLKVHPEWSKKRALTVARYAYFAQHETEKEQETQ